MTSAISATSATARSRLGRLYWQIAERLPPAWRPRFARFAVAVAHARRAVRRVRRRAGRNLYRAARPLLRQRASAGVVQWLARRYPPVRLPGSGPVWLVDARGVPTAPVATTLAAWRQRPDAPRLVALVDDPRVDALRTAGIAYEYLPGHLDAAQVQERRELVTWSYGIAHEVLFTQL